MQLLSSLGKVFVVLKDKVAIDLNKNVEQNIIQLKLFIILEIFHVPLLDL